ncbi:MAG: LysM peptidoglycan-binding domain-containing protein [Planctomycetota bacterium]|nr:MAG: LysM peptidoglycan-binding domain-containing protein [Planctomycetota bacterium]
MALTSQMARTGSGGRLYTSRRRGRRRANRTRRVVGVTLLLVLISAAAFWWIKDEPAPAAAEAARAAEPGGASEPLAIGSTPVAGVTEPRIRFDDAGSNPAPARPEPDELTMGAPLPPGGANHSPIADPDDAAPAGADSAVAALIADAERALASNEPLVARLLLNRALHDPRASEADRASIRARLSALNDEILFSPRIVEGDPLTERYVIKPNDSLAKIVKAENLAVDWRLIQRINRIGDPRRIRPGQTIKLIRGPFDAVIDKSDYRMDVYARLADDGSADARVYIASFPVGLGQYGSTPVGAWVVRRHSKLVNPPWTNPQTGQRYSADNPDNPIGERWIGLEGVDENTTVLSGYGIHGTIEPESVGAEASMGCVRMRAEDVDFIYELLTEGVSRVEIIP